MKRKKQKTVRTKQKESTIEKMFIENNDGWPCDPVKEDEIIVPWTFNGGKNPRDFTDEQLDGMAIHALGVMPCTCPYCCSKIEFTYQFLRKIVITTLPDGTQTGTRTWVIKINYKRTCLPCI